MGFWRGEGGEVYAGEIEEGGFVVGAEIEAGLVFTGSVGFGQCQRRVGGVGKIYLVVDSVYAVECGVNLGFD